ncbi:hypothetical protein BH10CYA1_BH10CYA1_19880 [soil metagenome]
MNEIKKVRNVDSVKVQTVIHWIFSLVAISIGLFQAYQWRFNPFTEDIISYLDSGNYFLQGNFAQAVSSYWSPLYGCILATVLLFQPHGSSLEIPIIKAVNCLIFSADTAVFVYFLGVLQRHFQQQKLDKNDSFEGLSSTFFLVVMYCTYIYSFLFLGGTYIDTPDLLVSGFVMAAVALLVEIKLGKDSWFDYVLFGIVLALGYLAKAVFFTIALLLVALASVYVKHKSPKKLLVSVAVSIALCAPYVASISLKHHHFTMSEVLRYGHSWSIMHKYEYVHGRDTTFTHPTRIIFKNPTVYEFASPVGGTFPPWYDPTYWFDGVQLSFEPSMELWAFWWNFVDYLRLFLGIVIFGFAVLTLIARKVPFSRLSLLANAPYLVPGVAGLALYLVSINMWTDGSERYLSVFVLLLIAGLLQSIRLPRVKTSRIALTLMASVFCVYFSVVVVFMQCAHYIVCQNWTENNHSKVVDKLRQLGLHSGDRVCHLGTIRYFWAHQGGFRIVADIRDLKGFWTMTPARREQLFNVLKQLKVKAIVEDPSLLRDPYKPSTDPGPGWYHIDRTTTYIYLIQ